MKKIILMCAVAGMYIALFIPKASGQVTTGFAVTKTGIPETIQQKDEVIAVQNSDKEFMNGISINAARAFIKKFKNAENVTWHKTSSGGYLVKFINDSIQTSIWYNDDGSWNYILKRYEEKKMSRDLRTLIKRNFFDHTIIEVVEMMLPKMEEEIVYRVLIKSEDNYKILVICNEEMEIAADYTKP